MDLRADAAEPVVEVDKLTKVFHDFWRRPKVRAVQDLDLCAYPGQILGLLGPNGSGKSTTLKALLGLIHPTSGTVRIYGRSPSHVATKRQIGYLPEESHLYDYLTPGETLDFCAKLFGLDRPERRRRIDQLLAMVGLQNARNRLVGELSRGMARRVGLAQALINDPGLLILDEPTSGLDPIGTREIKDLLAALASRGKTIVLSSHLLADVEDVCHRIIVLYNGRTQACGRVRDLLQEQNRVRITVPSLDPRELKAVIEWLRSRTRGEPAVDHPSQNLEQFFLTVIRRAHDGDAASSSVARTEGIAPFLSGSARPAERGGPAGGA